MTKAELIEALKAIGFTTEDGEDFGDSHGRHVRFRAPKVTEGTAAVLWRESAEQGVPRRAVVPFAEVLHVLEGAPKIDAEPMGRGPAMGSMGRP